MLTAVAVQAGKSADARRKDGISGHCQIAAGGVLEADRGGQAGGHFPVRLRLGGAGTGGGQEIRSP